MIYFKPVFIFLSCFEAFKVHMICLMGKTKTKINFLSSCYHCHLYMFYVLCFMFCFRRLEVQIKNLRDNLLFWRRKTSKIAAAYNKKFFTHVPCDLHMLDQNQLNRRENALSLFLITDQMEKSLMSQSYMAIVPLPDIRLC